MCKFFNFMSRKKNRDKVFISLNPEKMVIVHNDETGNDLSIVASVGKYNIEIGRYCDKDAEYLKYRVKEILDYIQDK